MTPQFSKVPQGWYYACSARQLSRDGPVGVELDYTAFVTVRDSSSRAIVLYAGFGHMDMYLACGRVGRWLIRCPQHDWRWHCAGRCVRIPASDDIPPFEQQAFYPSQD